VSGDLEISTTATTGALLACLDRIGEFGAVGNLDPGVMARVRIVVEELFTNTIKYGYAGECDKVVRLRLSQGPGLTLTYEDDAPLFDPTRWTSGEDGRSAAEQLREGQAGLALLFGLTSTATYESRDGCNRLVATFAPR
jgi:anti-sigma regulatory factor (Ser/Thr protein kinase)